MQKMTKKEIIKKGSEIRPTVHVGKEGITEGIVEEIKAQIKNSKLIKVRVLPNSSLEIKNITDELQERTGAKVVETRGFTVLICDPRTY